MRRSLFLVMIAAAVGSSASAQSRQSMNASIRGGGGDEGKCTIEVEVDGVAEVEVRGDRASIHTLQGQPSVFRRFECNSVLPRNPSDFRFKGVDGRGQVDLVRDPGSGGAAVIRIVDSKGGREGYTFDLEWRGGGGYNDGYRNDRPFGNDRRSGRVDDRRNGRADDRYDRFSVDDSVGACQDAVRAEARREYGVRNPRFRSMDRNDARGNRDRVLGEFEDQRGDLYEYACTVNAANGDVRRVNVRRR
ncbi:MAG TPA: hypothetical protein VES20_04250 [Bryobacteraceae bacterium]|nr:hypothetical protein [Bryobacteraceae bacterium]